MLSVLGYIGFLGAFFVGTVAIYYTLLKVSLI